MDKIQKDNPGDYNNQFIVIRYKSEYVKVPIDSILYCKADGCYTRILMANGIEYYVCKSIAFLDSVLKNFNFIRCHRSFLVNGTKIEKYCPSTKSIITSGQSIPVSRRKGFGISNSIIMNNLLNGNLPLV